MTSQITVRIPDELAKWLDTSESKTQTVVDALRAARRAEMHDQITAEYTRAPADTDDDWGNPATFAEANRAITWRTDER